MVSLENRLELASLYLNQLLQQYAPKDTWNLTFNGIALEQVTPKHWKIVIGGEGAPYAVFTNEQWISEKWNGKKNPNEGWIEKTIEIAKPFIANIMSGTISSEEIEKEMMNSQNQMNNEFFNENIDALKRELAKMEIKYYGEVKTKWN